MMSVSLAVECLLVLTTRYVFSQQKMSMVLTAVEHLNQATAEATDISERCAIKTEETAGTGTANEKEEEEECLFATSDLRHFQMPTSIVVVWLSAAVKQILVAVDPSL